jgi:hypothetical protein
MLRCQFRCLANRTCDERETRADSGEPATAAFSRARRAAEQAEWITYDRGFVRFLGLAWREPPA